MFFLLLIFICQYLYINYILNIKNPNIVKTTYNYKLKDEDINHSATIYHTNKNAKRVILFLSGAYQLGFDFYITKIMNDLDIEYDSLMSNYEFICYEKKNKASFVIYDDVYNYISYLDKKINKIEELILFGFSAGGVVASHVMTRCKDMTCKKKIIMYDTPWQVHDNVDHFKNNIVYRFDIMFFWKVIDVYSKHYNYNEIKHHITNKKWNSGSDELTQLIKNVHNCSHEEFYTMTGFNFEQTPDTEVYTIYSKNDPFVIREKSDLFVAKNKGKINFKHKKIEKNTWGHCSDMAFSCGYLKNVINSIFIPINSKDVNN